MGALFEPEIFDLGNVHTNTKHDLFFKNLSDKTIRYATTSCGCTTAKSDDNNITGSIDTKGGSDFYDFKLLNKTITVLFMDKTEHKLYITGKVYKRDVDLNLIQDEEES